MNTSSANQISIFDDANQMSLFDYLSEDDCLKNNNEPIVKRGQIWKLGNHRLMCGDSTDKNDVERLMEGGGRRLTCVLHRRHIMSDR